MSDAHADGTRSDVSAALMVSTFVQLADTLTDHYDVIDFLAMLTERCASLIDIDEAGVMIADPRGVLQVVASSSEQAQLLELFQLQNRDGPCLDSFRTGEEIVVEDLRLHRRRWPTFAEQALASGYQSVISVPMRLRREVIGALNMFRVNTGKLSEEQRMIARALADIATIGLIQQRTITDLRTTQSQLQTALQSRVTLEQAKGAIAERYGLSVDEAFIRIRTHARGHNRLLTELAGDIVNNRFDLR